nr:hypothetical protein [uncultured Draconibacterium sp.]
MKRRKKKNNTQLIKQERKHQLNQYYTSIKYNMKLIGDIKAFETLDKTEKAMLHICRIRPYKIVNAEDSKLKLIAKDIRFINKCMSNYLQAGHVVLGGKKISYYNFAFYIETLYLFYRNAKEGVNPEFCAGFPIFETKEFEERRMDVIMALTKYLELVAWSVSDLTHRTVRFVKQKYDNGTDLTDLSTFYNNYFIEARKVETETIKLNGNTRTIYEICVNADQEFIPLTIKAEELGINTLMHDFELKVYIQQHAIIRFKERLGEYFGLNSYSMIIAAMYNKPIEQEPGKSYLFPVELSKTRFGYLKAELNGNKLVILTFLFITNNGTPEGQKLNNLGLEKEDKKYLGIDQLDIFINSDIKKDEQLTHLFSSAGCGGLFKIDKTLISNIKSEEVARAAFLNQYLGIG